MSKKLIIIVGLMSLILILSSCGADTDQAVVNQDDEIVLGSFVDTEGGILGNMILLALEDNGYEIVDKVQFGTPDVHRNALLEGELHIGVDYTGNGQFYSEGYEEDLWRDADAGYQAIREYDMENNNLVWLSPAKANNTEALAVKREFAEANDITDMYDFAEYVNNGGYVKFITSQLFAEKQTGLLGMEEAYGFSLSPDQLIMLPHGNTAETLSALANETDGVNVALAYGTDGSIADLDLVVIDDPLSIPPVYEPSAIVRGEVLEKYPEIEVIIEDVFATLTLENLQEMNKQVIVDGAVPSEVARMHLEENGILAE
ncbi:glycine betaine ABC transporter substrate-binding protein [Gudongella sp. DL1XJH-153]|uniref:glycine betaine ABC transporter substrate-binding protein n=1 Tax=Gudongella sp. DL1XJH-153 TaxID=3409804 RepID=UPI003BB4F9A0